MGDLARQADVIALEEAMRGVDPDFSEELHHHFGFQTYAREMRLKKDSVIVGKTHRFPCVNILSKGMVAVQGEFESAIYEAPHTWVSVAGTKRATACLEDCVWTTIHQNPTNTQDLKELENYLIGSGLEDL